MIITQELAQQIVDTITPIVRQNINIMDNTGRIIGSGQPDRIHSLHRGSLSVLESGECIEIYPEELERYPGSQPGVNRPIVLRGRSVGVAGVSGCPDEVRDTAKLVTMVAELILERELLIEEFKTYSSLKEQFVHLLLSPQAPKQQVQIGRIAGLLRIDPSLFRLAAVASLKTPEEAEGTAGRAEELVFARYREHLSQLLETSGLFTPQDLFVFGDNGLIMLKTFDADSPPDEFAAWGGQVAAALGREQPVSLQRLALGSLARQPLQLYHSYREAQSILRHAAGREKVVSVYDFDALADYLIQEPGAVQTCLAFQYLQEKLSRRIDRTYAMRDTIQGLLAHNLNVSDTAKALYIHRNTLIFRLDKLRELTGLWPARFFAHAVLCKLLVAGDKEAYCD
ncbi:CdaR family transcriptional regulator [Acetonema longum]|uniref:Putative sugar diacid recognition n=1 Tax=Acetonema longum DSM 6540 TaxID=1009370 RepID=F7NJN1_9FIRM|nr:sugar diacid recognition domain-containing protein [Acetonema longum]EGO63752.1 putative sugar diacid recognition [Acetonema longum DSM 6540]